MSNEQEQLRILKNLIMSDDYFTQNDLQKVVKAMNKNDIEIRPQINKEVEKR